MLIKIIIEKKNRIKSLFFFCNIIFVSSIINHIHFSFMINDIFVYLKSITISVIDMVVDLNNFNEKIKIL